MTDQLTANESMSSFLRAAGIDTTGEPHSNGEELTKGVEKLMHESTSSFLRALGELPQDQVPDAKDVQSAAVKAVDALITVPNVSAMSSRSVSADDKPEQDPKDKCAKDVIKLLQSEE